MKNRISVLALVALMLIGTSLTSCEAVKNSNNTQKGAGIGAVAGAVLGGVLGNNLGKGGNGALGAVLGAVLGGVAGGVIGNKMDKQAREIDSAIPGAEVEREGEGIQLTLNESSVRFDTNKLKNARPRINMNEHFFLESYPPVYGCLKPLFL